MELMQITTTAIEIARAAGRLLAEGFGQTGKISNKSSSIDLVTEYDLAAETLITGRLREAFPHHTLVGEEGGQTQTGDGEYTWYIDPLDGTNNFAHGLPIFVVSMGLYQGNSGLVGVIVDPLRAECFFATRGQGAFRQVEGREPVRMQVSQARTLESSLVATGFPYDRHTSTLDNAAQFTAFLKRVQGIRRMGAAALDLAYVAAGRLDGYWEFKLHRWDVAAGLLLITEAGGQVSDAFGRPVAIENERLSVAAGNQYVHPQILAVLRDVATDQGTG